jgi:hypothetical protein
MKKYIIILVAALIIPNLIYAEIFAKVGTAGLQFLKLGVDARAIGMGEAYTAVTNDISSVYWNPAGLALRYENQVFFSHTQYVANIMHEFVAVSRVTNIGSFALSASLLHMDQMDVYDGGWEPTGETFTASDLAVGLTYANAFTDKFSFGFTGKYLQENLDEYSVSGYSFDLGSLYNVGWRNLTVGMSVRNFGPDMKYDVDEDDIDVPEDPLVDNYPEAQSFKIPLNFSLGIAIDLYSNDNNRLLIASLQLDNCVDRQETYNLGFEYKMGTFKIRAGQQFNYDAHGFSTGFGWTVPTSFAIFDIDYSYSDYGYLSESFIKTPHRLSLKLFY